MIRNLLFFILVVTLYSCNNRQKETPKADAFAKMEMMDADRNFSKMSDEGGFYRIS